MRVGRLFGRICPDDLEEVILPDWIEAQARQRLDSIDNVVVDEVVRRDHGDRNAGEPWDCADASQALQAVEYRKAQVHHDG
jgi:hypothetical protein